MVIYNTPTRLAGCGLCGADGDVAPVLPPDENEYAVAADPNAIPNITSSTTSFDKQVAAALKPFPSWAIGIGIGVVALGVVGAVWAVSKRA